jgi:hypothetical protein
MTSVLAAWLFLAAAGSDLAAAQRAHAEFEYGRCRDRARAALLVPATRAERIDAWKLLGLCSAAEGDTDAAREAFQWMLAIDREARLPEGLSPRFTSSFREAKGRWVDVEPLALVIDAEETDADGRVVRVRIRDAAELVEKIAWRSEGGVLSRPVRRADVVELAVPADAAVTVVALDAHGGEVAVLELAAQSVAMTGPLEDPAPAPDPVAPAPFPWLVVGSVAGAAVVAGVGVAVGVAILSAPPQVTLVPSVVFAE